MSNHLNCIPRDWPKYNRAKIKEGNIFIYFSSDVESAWYADNAEISRGEGKIYSDLCIELILTLRYLLKRPLRQVQGLTIGLLELAKLNLKTPDYTTLSRRAKSLEIKFRNSDPSDTLHLSVDATGVGLFRDSEWHGHKHGKKRKQKWLKMSLTINAKTGEILANTLATSDDSDSSQVEGLLAQIPDMLESFYGDGAYDKNQTFEALKKHQEFPVDVIVPPIETLGVPDDPSIPLSRREQHRDYLNRHGRDKWRNKHGFGKREKSEGTFARFKATFGEKLMSRHNYAQKLEIDLKCKLLNRFNELYSEGYVKKVA